MSGVAGLVRLDGAPAEAGQASAMAATMNHRGGDSAGVWGDGPAAFAATLRYDLPESVGERQPLVGPGGEVLVADARIDNRDELLAALGGRVARGASDAGIVLAACRTWGDDAPARLVGDFAFAFWEPGRRRLLCARDALGVRPLAFVHRPGHLLAFASESKALFTLADVPRRVDERALLAYLDGRDLPQEATFYESVRRLPPGHRLVADAAGCRTEPYWLLDPTRETPLGSPAEHVESFRDLFDRAVAARLRSARPVGTMLSGGLDSSSIAVTAGGLSVGRLPTFSFRFDGVPASDERRHQDHVLASGRFDPHFVAGDVLDPFVDFDRIVHLCDEPTGAGNLFLHWAAWGLARDAGVGVLLDGFFGDSTVAYGDDRLPELLRRGRLLAFAREVRARRRVGRGGRRMVVSLISSSFRAILPHGRRPGTRVIARSPSSPVFVPLHPAAAGRLPARPPFSADEGFHTVRRRHHEDLTHEAYTPMFEALDKGSAGQGVDVRFPFADRRLVEFCLALPSALLQRDGWDRWVLRESMVGRLPDPVRWRPGKADLLPNLAQAMRTTGRARLAAELEDPDGPLARFVDGAALAEQLNRFDAGDSAPVAALWTAACASAWLRAQSQTPTSNTRTGPPPEA